MGANVGLSATVCSDTGGPRPGSSPGGASPPFALFEGTPDGTKEGASEGTKEGASEGITEGTNDGSSDGMVLGT
jgi:hypothetical protein